MAAQNSSPTLPTTCHDVKAQSTNLIVLENNRVSYDCVDALEALLAAAKEGRLIGLAFAAMYKRDRFIVDVVGEAERRPVFTRGMIAVLEDRAMGR